MRETLSCLLPVICNARLEDVLSTGLPAGGQVKEILHLLFPWDLLKGSIHEVKRGNGDIASAAQMFAFSQWDKAIFMRKSCTSF